MYNHETAKIISFFHHLSRLGVYESNASDYRHGGVLVLKSLLGSLGVAHLSLPSDLPTAPFQKGFILRILFVLKT